MLQILQAGLALLVLSLILSTAFLFDWGLCFVFVAPTLRFTAYSTWVLLQQYAEGQCSVATRTSASVSNHWQDETGFGQESFSIEHHPSFPLSPVSQCLLLKNPVHGTMFYCGDSVLRVMRCLDALEKLSFLVAIKFCLIWPEHFLLESLYLFTNSLKMGNLPFLPFGLCVVVFISWQVMWHRWTFFC